MTRQGEADPRLLAGLMVRREAISTSALEGTHAPIDAVLASEVSPQSPTSEVIEVRNYITASAAGVARLHKLPVCKRLACELHEILVTGTRSEDHQKGSVRDTQVVIGPKHENVEDLVRHADFIPPPPGQMLQEGLADWERWLNLAESVHPLVRIALSHYQFETLHPFTDGNGRIGRLLAVLQLIEAKILDDAVVNLSPYLEQHRESYTGLLQRVSAEGAWDEWITFFCEALKSQATDGIERSRRLLTLKSDTLDDLRDAKIRGVAVDIVNDLLVRPVITARSVREAYNVGSDAAYKALRRLSERDVIVEITGGNYGKIYAAQGVLNILR